MITMGSFDQIRLTQGLISTDQVSLFLGSSERNSLTA
jgi:hypothetical protein